MGMRQGISWMVAIGTLVALAMAGAVTAHEGHGTPEAQRHGDRTATPGHDSMMGSTGNGVVYVTITNTGEEDDALVGAETDRAERIEIHEMIVADGTARMQPVDGPLPIPAGETVSLEPGGLHLMLVNLTEDIRLGDVYEVTLEFERAGEVTLQVPVRLDAEPVEGDEESELVEAGDLMLEDAWSRPAPRLTAGTGMPMASPEATPAAP